MAFLLIAASILLPLLFVYVQYRWKQMGTFFNLLMLVSVIIFGDIAAVSLFQILRDNVVYMTRIHGLFLNPLFMAAGAYIGIYAIYRLMLLSWSEFRDKNGSNL